MPAPSALANTRVCIFDAYGTLFDFASAAESCRDVLGDDTNRVTALWRDKQLQYSWLRSVQGRHADFWQVTGDALDFAIAALGLKQDGLHSRLMDLYRTVRPFPEVPGVLEEITRAGIKIAVLSNGTPAMLSSAIEAGGLSHLIGEVVSVEEVGVFKPHPDVYRRACARVGFGPPEIAFVSSNGWDIHGASAFGLRTVWCNRYDQPEERLPGKPDFSIPNLQGLPALLNP